MRLGRGPATLAACLNVAAFDFFFVPPRLSFAVSDLQYLVTFAVMLAVGLLTGQLTGGLRFQARIAASRERRAQSLFELTRDLSAALLAVQVVELGESAARSHFGGEAVVLATDARDELVQPATPPAGFDGSVADWAFRNGQPAGLATGTLAAQPWHYVPLQAPMRVRGVLALAAGAGALAPHSRAARSSWRRWHGRSPSRWNACTTWRSHSRRWSTWSPNGCATRCSRPSRTTCARRSRR